MVARYSIDFEMGFKNHEWRYCFYKSGDSAAAMADSYKDPLNAVTSNFKTALVGFHATGVELVAVHVANDENPGTGDSRTRAIKMANGGGSASADIIDVTGNSMLSSMFGNTGGKRKFTMSGLPDAMIERTQEGSAVQNAIFNSRFGILLPHMLAQGFLIRTVAEPAPENLFKVRVMEPTKVSIGEPAVLVEDASHTLFTTTVAHGFDVGDIIDFIHRTPTRATEELTGLFSVVEVPTATRFTVATRVNFRGSNYLPSNLSVYKPDFEEEEITQWVFDDWGTRKRGEGGGPRGRSSSKKRKAV